MREELLAVLAAGEERVTVGGKPLVIRELECAADVPDTSGTVLDFSLALIVRCVKDEDGNAVFTDADIPKLKRAGRKRMGPLINAVLRVNGFSGEAVEVAEKNSGADPGNG